MAQSSSTARYQTDAQLAALLRDAGAAVDVAAAIDIIRGVAAAPGALDRGEWLAMIADPMPKPLGEQLAALAARMAAECATPTVSGPAPPERLDRLRAELARRGLDGFLVPLADEHQGEFIAPRAQRLAWLTGFTGSAGLAIVLNDRAAIFVDGRYTLQVREQVDVTRFTPLHVTETPPTAWIEEQRVAGARIGIDPWLHTLDAVERFEAACRKADATLVAVDSNPVDAVWADQPPPPLAPALAHPDHYAGRESQAKRAEIANTLARDKAAAVVLTAPDSIAWLLNMRGGDVANTPLVQCFAVLHADATVDLFVDPRKITPGLRRAFGDAVRTSPPDALGAALDRLGERRLKVLADPATAPAWVFCRLHDAQADVLRATDPVQLPKTCKNDIELAGTRAAHRRDGAALTRFLAWLAEAAPKGGETEMSAAHRLAECRASGAHYRGPSFDTISGAGPNGAIVHYRVTAASNRMLEPGQCYLIDSGGQYLDGTTDVTRTVWIAGRPPPAELRDRFTRVLKGHISLGAARFPVGTTGSQLDPLARVALWEAGVDYDHGTGHGVGSYLGVHEGPARISKLPSTVALRPGMILSNEPGYYRTGAFGIRIENLVAVREDNAMPGAERDMLAFETLTLAPIERALIEPTLMTPAETSWIDTYHARVRAEIGPQVDDATQAWLDAATAPLG